MKLAAIVAPLRHGVFARYMTGEFISMIGTWMQIAVQGWVITDLTKDASVLGELNMVATLPMLILALVGGRIADRYDKRTILLVVLVLQFIGAALLGHLVATGQIAIWHLFAVTAVLGVATAFEVPAVSAFVPELVPKEIMSGAIAIDRATFHLTRLIGPSIGGYLVGAYGTPVAYYVNAATFLALGFALLSIRSPRAEAAAREPGGQRIGEGIAYVRGDGPTKAMIGIMAAMTMFVSPFVLITMPFYTRYLLGLDAEGMGRFMAVSGIGSVIGTLLLLTVSHGRRSLALKLAAVAIVAAICGLACAHSFFSAGASMILLTLGLSTTFGTANIVIQERAPDEMRGRVSSVSALSYFGVVTFSGWLITEAVKYFGMRPTLIGGAVGYALAATLLLAGRERLASAPVETAVAEI